MHRLFLLCGLAALLSGCMGYRVGPTNGTQAGSRSIEIAPPLNSTLEPRLSDAVSHALRREVQRDGTFRLDTKGSGDVIVTTTLTEYRRQGVTFRPEDTLTVRDYRINLFAFVNAYDRVTGKTLLNQQFRGDTMVRIGNDQASAERQALPILAENLARRISDALADGDWQ